MSDGAAKLGLGTVQWGMPYGISNVAGQTGASEVARILDRARGAGVSLLDTAHGYGDAERVLGECAAASQGFAIVTKTPPHRRPLEPADVARFEAACSESLRRLDAQQLEALLVHSADNLLGPNADRLWAALEEIRGDGRARKIGVSVYHPGQLERIVERFRVDLVQLPYSVFDQRFTRSGALAALKREGIEVHARSAFLQGLVLMQPGTLPPHFASIARRHADLHRALREAGMSPLEGALRHCLARPDLDRVVVGCENLAQLGEILRAAPGEFPGTIDTSVFAIEEERIIDPSQWPRLAETLPT